MEIRTTRRACARRGRHRTKRCTAHEEATLPVCAFHDSEAISEGFEREEPAASTHHQCSPRALSPSPQRYICADLMRLRRRRSASFSCSAVITGIGWRDDPLVLALSYEEEEASIPLLLLLPPTEAGEEEPLGGSAVSVVEEDSDDGGVALRRRRW